MKVKQLITKLNKLDPEATIYTLFSQSSLFGGPCFVKTGFSIKKQKAWVNSKSDHDLVPYAIKDTKPISIIVMDEV